MSFDHECPYCGEAYTPHVSANGKRSELCSADDCQIEHRARVKHDMARRERARQYFKRIVEQPPD